jgi:hypothetical protein
MVFQKRRRGEQLESDGREMSVVLYDDGEASASASAMLPLMR